MVTSVDVARYLGLSQSTVSRALRGHPSVAPSTKARILSTARELGYVPDAAARMMVTRRTHAVGIVVAELSIVGFDDSGPSRWAFINLTTVHQPIAEMSYEAVDRLAGRIEGEPPSQTRKPVFSVRLEVRGTAAPPQAVLRPPLRSSV